MKLDLHVHTEYSLDGIVSPQEYLKIVKKQGLAGLAVTDHNEIKGAVKVFKLAKEHKDILVIRGVEKKKVEDSLEGR